jgi:hypothetical protein
MGIAPNSITAIVTAIIFRIFSPVYLSNNSNTLLPEKETSCQAHAMYRRTIKQKARLNFVSQNLGGKPQRG